MDSKTDSERTRSPDLHDYWIQRGIELTESDSTEQNGWERQGAGATTDRRTQGTAKIKREGLDGIKFSQAFVRVGPSCVQRCHRLEIDGKGCGPGLYQHRAGPVWTWQRKPEGGGDQATL